MKISKELAKGSTALLVLGVLSKEEMYGYQIIKQVELKSENVFQMNEGTLYPILHALEQEGYLTSAWREAEEGGRRRKYYKITADGSLELKSQRKQWKEYETAVNRVLNSAEA